MGHATCALRFVGDALPLDAMGKMLDLADPRYRADMHTPPDYDGLARAQVWTAIWEEWDLPFPPVVNAGNPTSEAVMRLIEHLEPHRLRLRQILRTKHARGEVLVVYTKLGGINIALTPRLQRSVGALGLDTRIWVESLL